MNSLTNFSNLNFYDAALALFEELNIPLNKLESLPFKPQDILTEVYSESNTAHQTIGDVYALGMVNDGIFKGEEDFESLEDVSRLKHDYEGLIIFGVTLKTKLSSRSQLSEITRAFNRVFHYTPVTIIFRYGDHLALANAERTKYLVKHKEGEKAGKVTLLKDISISNTNAAHLKIIFGDKRNSGLRINNKGIDTFSDLYKYWLRQFSLQSLNDQFYQDLQNWFYYALTHIQLPYKEDFINEKENIKNFLIRLLSRTIFCWFVKEKGLIRKELLELTDWRGKKYIITVDIDSVDFLESNSYYRGVLQNVFYNALNQKEKKSQKDFGWKKYLPSDFDYSWFTEIPYLNGSIFDKLPEDNAKETIEDTVIAIPNFLFYGKNSLEQQSVGTGRNKRQELREVHQKGLNQILNEYKFTLAENTPFEEDIALDPEMLGLVFENLLAELDPNLEETTKKSIRNLTGSYYTPRKIIHEMVNDSLNIYLSNYLQTNYPALQESKEKISSLIYGDNIDDDAAFNYAVVDALDKFKFLDPACGSGAFPLVALHRMTDLLKMVDPRNENWINLKLERVDKQQQSEFKKILTSHLDDYGRKLGIIRDSIYGIDIQPMAVQITKLRFFISLLIDQVDGKEITPLPNIETKIICADSLNNIKPDLFASTAVENLKEARARYYQPNNSKEEKDGIADEIVEILNDAFPQFATKVTGKKSDLRNRTLLKDWFEHGTIAAPFFNLEFFFPEIEEHGGFDCVMGNPPYGGFKVTDDVRYNLDIVSKDPYGAFIARFLNSGDRSKTPLKYGGVLSYIVSDTFMTIKSHLPLRKHLMNHAVHKMIRVHPDTFRATVNTAIILVEKLPKDAKLNGRISLMADMTNISIHENYEHFIKVFALTRGVDFGVQKSISNNDYAVYFYPQKLISTNSNLPFFVASPKLFRLMNDGNDKTNLPKTEIRKIAGKNVAVRSIEINGKNVELVKLGDIADVKVGLQTGDNQSYLFQKPDARGNYRSVEPYWKFLLTEDDLRKIRENENLRLSVIEKGINTTDPKNHRYFGGRYIIPYDKGGESDSDSGWLPNFFVEAQYYLDWSEHYAQSLLNEKLINDKSTKPYPRNKLFYFVEGLSFSDTGVYSPTFRLNFSSVFDQKGSTIISHIDNKFLLGILNSKLLKFLLRNSINHTVSSHVDSQKESVIYPTTIAKIVDLVDKIIQQQKKLSRYDYASNEQIEIDKLVYETYGLNIEDIEEIENWYARRYPKLSVAQKANLRLLGKSDDYLELYSIR